jgi:hypothetical protein
MYSIRTVEREDDLIRLELFCNRCGVIYQFIDDSVELDTIYHITSGHRHYNPPNFWDSPSPLPYFYG